MPGQQAGQGAGQKAMEDNQAEAGQVDGAGVSPGPAGGQNSQEQQGQEDKGNPAHAPAPASFENVEDDQPFPIEEKGQGIAPQAMQPEHPTEGLAPAHQAAEARDELKEEQEE